MINENAKTVSSKGLELSVATVKSWLSILYRLTNRADGLRDLESAIAYVKSLKIDEAEREIVNTLTLLFKEEKNGNLKPPPSIKKLYNQVITENNEGI